MLRSTGRLVVYLAGLALAGSCGRQAAEVQGGPIDIRVVDGVTGRRLDGVSAKVLSGDGTTVLSTYDGGTTGLLRSVREEAGIVIVSRDKFLATRVSMRRLRQRGDAVVSLRRGLDLDGIVESTVVGLATAGTVTATTYLDGNVHRVSARVVNGRFRIGQLPGGRTRFEARISRHVRSTHEVMVDANIAVPPLHLSVSPAAQVSGTVIDQSGRPATGLRVMVHYPSLSVQEMLILRGSSEAVSGESGGFLLPSVLVAIPFELRCGKATRRPFYQVSPFENRSVGILSCK